MFSIPNPYGSFRFLFHYPNNTNITPIYSSSFHFVFHYPNRDVRVSKKEGSPCGAPHNTEHNMFGAETGPPFLETQVGAGCSLPLNSLNQGLGAPWVGIYHGISTKPRIGNALHTGFHVSLVANQNDVLVTMITTMLLRASMVTTRLLTL